MAQAITMPKLGQTAEESTIVKWHKTVGDKIDKGDILFEIETDKAVLEVESFFEGTLLKTFVGEGETVPVMSVVGYIGAPGETIPDAPPAAPAAPAAATAATPAATAKPESTAPAAAAPATTPQPTVSAATPAVSRPASAPATAPTPAPTVERKAISPRARALARRSAIDYGSIAGTGPGGRIVEADVRRYLSEQGYDQRPITPAALVLAIAEGIDVLSVRGSGDGGRILVTDIRRALAERPQPMNRMRSVIADRLTQSFTTTPHFYVTVDVDMTELLQLRRHLKETGKDYTVTVFIIEAVILALQAFPVVNSRYEDHTVIWNSHIHLGMATALKEGLVVPVIRDAETLNLSELQQQIVTLSTKARDGKLLPDEMSGSTFTVSNMGMLNVENFTAIINPGEGAILAVASTQPKAVVRDGKIVVRSMMKMTVSSDHRIIDGSVGARFINAVKDKLEDMELWKTLTS